MSQFPPNPGPPGAPPQQGWQQGPPPQQGWQQGGPPQQWGPGPQGAPPSGGSKTGLYVVLALVAVVVLGGGAFLLMGGDDGGGGGSSPEDAVRNYISASESGDCGRMVDSVTKASWAVMAGDPSAASASRDQAVSWCEANIDAVSASGDPTQGGEVGGMEVTSESGGQATVAVEVTGPDGESTVIDLGVAQEDGSWKVDLAAGFGDLGGEIPDDFEDMDIEDIEQQMEDLEDELGTDFTIPEG